MTPMTNVQSSLCAICQHAPTRQLCTNCGHNFCGHCIGAYIWKDTCRGQPTSCPVCRQAVKSCTADPTSVSTYWCSLKVGRVQYKVDVDGGRETCMQRISKILNVPPHRVKLIAKGVILKDEADVQQACSKGVQLLVTASATQKGTLKLMLMLWLEWFWGSILRLAVTVLDSHVVRAVRLFFSSFVTPPAGTKKEPPEHSHDE